MLTLDELRAKRDAILRIVPEHGASNVRVFGSVLYGDGPDSDIDLLVNGFEFADLCPGRTSFTDTPG